MNVSVNWLKKYVDLPKDLKPEEFGSKLTLATVEVEEVRNLAESLNNIFVGKISKLAVHPNADKLKLAEVDIKKEKLKVVCGGTNLKEGMLVAFAKVGAKVKWHGEGDLIALESAKIRGEESHGMICASEEIGLQDLFPGKEEGEILDLTSQNLKVGQPLAEALGLDDIIIDIDNKSLTNRPDLWGHYGMAREVAAIYNKKLKEYKVEKIKDGKEEVLKVDVKSSKKCFRYLGLIIDNIKVGPSPEWLVKDLQAVGQRSINNIVDITNYILFDLGQPMHAFDANLLKSNNIIVRTAENKEKIKTLDEQEFELDENDLVIADENQAVALAGIMGGANSEIKPETKKIILESANFDATSIRRTSAKLGLRTESSMRFEKSLDPNMALSAIQKAAELVLRVCPNAKVTSALVDEYPQKFDEIIIATDYDFIKQRIGQEIETKKIDKILADLGFEIKSRNGKIRIKVPSWRATKDVSLPEDLVEEVARMYGYDNLNPQMPEVEVALMEENQLRNLERLAKNLLVNAGGYTEVYNYSFVGREQIEKTGLNPNDNIEIENPISHDQTLLRTSLFSNLLKNVQENLRFYKNLKIFECGSVFEKEAGENLVIPTKENKLPRQPLILAGMITEEKNSEPFFAAKAALEFLLEKLTIEFFVRQAKQPAPFMHPVRNLLYEIKNEIVGSISEVHPAITQEMDIKQKVAYWQLDLSKLIKFFEKKYHYQPIAKFPGVELDVSLIVDERILWKDVRNIVLGTEPDLITEIKLFDVYKNDKMGVGKKSLAFHVNYQSLERTLEMKEVQKLHDKVISNLEKSLNAKVRKL